MFEGFWGFFFRLLINFLIESGFDIFFNVWIIVVLKGDGELFLLRWVKLIFFVKLFLLIKLKNEVIKWVFFLLNE